MATNRVELLEDEITEVIGGAMTFYTNGILEVDNIGTYTYTEGAKDRINAIRYQHRDWSLQQVLDEACNQNVIARI